MFVPQERLPVEQAAVRPFNLSAGYPLDQAPLIRAALLGLNLNHKVLGYQQLLATLRCQFLGVLDDEVSTRNRILRQLKATGRQTWPRTQIKQLVEKSGDAGKPSQFLRVLLDFSEMDRRSNSRSRVIERSPVQWASLFDWQLKQLQWPGSSTLNSDQYQQLAHWRTLLERFADLSASLGEITLSQALKVLKRLAADTSYQPQSADVPVQVLGLLEAGGLKFDHLWITGLNDVSWPAMPEPNPLIPQALQIKLQMPRASRGRELEFARQQMKELLQAAPDTVVSSASEVDGEPGRPAHAIADLEFVALSELPGDNAMELAPSRAPVMETFDASAVMPLVEGSQIGGGSSVLTDTSLRTFH